MEPPSTKKRPPDDSKAVIRVRLTPRSSRDALLGKEGDVYRIKLTAPPVDGRANRALVAFLAKTLGVPKRAVSILSGEKSREKTCSIQGMTAPAVDQALTGTR